MSKNIKTPYEWIIQHSGCDIDISEYNSPPVYPSELIESYHKYASKLEREEKIKELNEAKASDEALQDGWNAQNSIGFREGIRQAIKILKSKI